MSLFSGSLPSIIVRLCLSVAVSASVYLLPLFHFRKFKFSTRKTVCVECNVCFQIWMTGCACVYDTQRYNWIAERFQNRQRITMNYKSVYYNQLGTSYEWVMWVYLSMCVQCFRSFADTHFNCYEYHISLQKRQYCCISIAIGVKYLCFFTIFHCSIWIRFFAAKVQNTKWNKHEKRAQQNCWLKRNRR